MIAGVVVALSLAGCDSGGAGTTTSTVVDSSADDRATSTVTTATPTTTQATTSTTTTGTPAVEPLHVESVADYMLMVLRITRDAGVNEMTAELVASPSVESYALVLAALQSQAAEFARIVPPEDALAFHSLLVEQSEDAVGLYEGFIDAFERRDRDLMAELSEEAVRQTGAALDLARLQLDLLEIAFEGRTDAAASYALAVGTLGERLSSDVQNLIERITEVASGEEDFDLLLEVVEEEAAVLLALAEDWRGLHPPQSAAAYHVGQIYVAGGVGAALSLAAEAIRDEDLDALTEAFEGMWRLVGAAPGVAAAQQDMVIAALENVDEPDAPFVWARVPLVEDFGFGLPRHVVAFEDHVIMVALGGIRESSDGISWSLASAGEIDGGFDVMNDVIVDGPELIGVGSAERGGLDGRRGVALHRRTGVGALG